MPHREFRRPAGAGRSGPTGESIHLPAVRRNEGVISTQTEKTPELGDGYQVESAPEAEPRRRGGAFITTVMQFFVFPLAIVVVCTGIFVGFRWMSYERTTPIELVREIEGGSPSEKWLPSYQKRWQSAFELYGKLLDADPSEIDPQLAPEVVRVFEKTAGESSPNVRMYLANILGLLKPPEAVPPLVQAVAEDESPDVRLYSAMALGEIGDARAVPGLVEALGDEDAGVRKAVAYSLGRLGSSEAVEPLKGVLEDAKDDVRWNAALALARLGDRSGLPVIQNMLDRAHVTSVVTGEIEDRDEDLADQQVAVVMVNAIEGAALLGEPSLMSVIERISKSDENLHVRKAALQALERLGKPARE